jgi:hypothetical protein
LVEIPAVGAEGGDPLLTFYENLAPAPDTTTIDIDSNNSSSGGGCTYSPESKHFDMSFLFILVLGLLYPFRRKILS